MTSQPIILLHIDILKEYYCGKPKDVDKKIHCGKIRLEYLDKVSKYYNKKPSSYFTKTKISVAKYKYDRVIEVM